MTPTGTPSVGPSVKASRESARACPRAHAPPPGPLVRASPTQTAIRRRAEIADCRVAPVSRFFSLAAGSAE
eukprot:356384-Chlamydomonas_euryale.AAC.3